MDEAPCRFALECYVLSSTEARIDRQDDVQREFGLAVEHFYLLRLTIFGDGEILFIESSDGSPTLVDHGGEDADQLHVRLERNAGLLRRGVLTGSVLTVAERSQQRTTEQHAEVLHGRGTHLDAASRPVV